MQWDGTENAGFTKGTPWLHVNANYRTINAKACLEDENSIFYTYKKLIDYRKKTTSWFTVIMRWSTMSRTTCLFI